MNDSTNAAALERFEQENAEAQAKVLRLKQLKNIIWLIIALPTTALAAYIAYSHSTMEPQALAELAIPLLKWGSLACTIIYLAYIVMHMPLVRAIYHARSEIYPRYNAAVSDNQQKTFQWHTYLSKGENNASSGKTAALLLGAKVFSLFILIIFYQLSWIHALARTGVELNNEHYAFMGFIDFALFSSLLLFAVVLIFTRVSSLAGKKR